MESGMATLSKQRMNWPDASYWRGYPGFFSSGWGVVPVASPITALAVPFVVTEQGVFTSLKLSDESAYLGIPYAAPPLGTLRWRQPQPARFLGLFHATQFGNICPQLQNGSVVGSEDCLYLNVYVPDSEPPATGFPVMVWIPGGAFTSGASSEYDPTPLVTKANVIVVTINYRIGVLGFFAHPAIDAEGHLNADYGLMDQQFALKWVRRNIRAFGGDAKRVTIFGESAGGFSVLSNLASPTAEGLFERAIAESGAYAEFQSYWDPISVVPLATAETIGTPLVPAGTTLASDVGCGSQTAECLRSIPASTIVKAEPDTLYPIVDGTLLTQTLDSAFATGEFNHVPVIDGTNHDEWRLFVASEYDLAGSPLTDAEYPQAVAALVGQPVSSAFVNYLVNVEYPLSDYPPPPGYSVSAPLALGALGTDFVFACTARNADLELSKYVPTYTYEFNDETAPRVLPSVSFPLGDSHFVEVQYLFNLSAIGITPSFTPAQQQLSDTMIAYWTQFAKTGNPNSDGLPEWPSYIGAGGEFESLIAPAPTTESDSSFDADHKCSSFWDTF
jgi:para-nitrobenzyl esterase